MVLYFAISGTRKTLQNLCNHSHFITISIIFLIYVKFLNCIRHTDVYKRAHFKLVETVAKFFVGSSG